jgi:hypothetical protein
VRCRLKNGVATRSAGRDSGAKSCPSIGPGTRRKGTRACMCLLTNRTPVGTTHLWQAKMPHILEVGSSDIRSNGWLWVWDLARNRGRRGAEPVRAGQKDGRGACVYVASAARGRGCRSEEVFSGEATDKPSGMSQTGLKRCEERREKRVTGV